MERERKNRILGSASISCVMILFFAHQVFRRLGWVHNNALLPLSVFHSLSLRERERERAKRGKEVGRRGGEGREKKDRKRK